MAAVVSFAGRPGGGVNGARRGRRGGGGEGRAGGGSPPPPRGPRGGRVTPRPGAPAKLTTAAMDRDYWAQNAASTVQL
ncbi:hypothetical protein, partial [Nocardia asiatica]|uniref:hypothetical protein n=1 Tax=Nocardia asiatica TaxID=209252 RepID=UPI002454ECFA